MSRAALKEINNKWHLPLWLMANEEVSIEETAIEQVIQLITHEQLAHCTEAILLTPDLHPGNDIPVGTVADLNNHVLGKMIGRDIGCGMRLTMIDGLTKEELVALSDPLRQRLRDIFFNGQREVFTSAEQRAAIFRYGLPGLADTYEANADNGLWQYYPRSAIAKNDKVHNGGSFAQEGHCPAFDRYIKSSNRLAAPDTMLGVLGGGNHFAEIDYVDNIIEGETAYQWGLNKNNLAVFIHSGSLRIGAAAAQLGSQQLLPNDTFEASNYLQAMNNAANFAFVNRLVLTLMVIKALHEVSGKELTSQLVYDAPHNFIEQKEDKWRHRKGATPALGPEGVYKQNVFPSGHPVLVPGSMGTESWVLVGNGQQETLESAAHGAGRALSRKRAAATITDTALSLVVTPFDERQLIENGRSDLVAEHRRNLNEEAPQAYKAIEPVIDSMTTAGAVRRVASLRPLLTIKEH